MKNKSILLLVIFSFLLFFISVRIGQKLSSNITAMSINNSKSNERVYKSPDKFDEECANIKGLCYNGIKGQDYFYITNTIYLNDICLEIDGYSEFIVNVTPDSKIMDYNNLNKINFHDIEQYDVIFYNGKIKRAKDSASSIEVDENEIYVLKANDIRGLAIKEHTGKKELRNVRISYIDEEHILAQIDLKTNKNDSVIYLAYLNISKGVQVDRYCRNKYADLDMNKPFCDFTEGENEVVKIVFK